MYRRCSDVADKISEIIDREASLMTRFRFYTHLMVCPKCREYFSQFKLLKTASNQPDPEHLPEDFNKVMGFVMEEVENKKSEDPLDDPLRES